MLSAIIITNLAGGAANLAKMKAIVKQFDSVQNLGAMTVLWSFAATKSGILTQDEIALAYCNAASQSGKKNSIDNAIVNYPYPYKVLANMGEKEYEILFTFESRRSTCFMKTPRGKHILICKGAVEDVLAFCSHIRCYTSSVLLDEEGRQNPLRRVLDFNTDSYQVILVALRDLVTSDISEDLEVLERLNTELTAEGLLSFLDPLKDDANSSITRLQDLRVDVRILTGDNQAVVMKVCRDIELIQDVDDQSILSINGPELAGLDGDDFHKLVKECKVLTPDQKWQVVTSLKDHGEVVGMLGDGVNDCVSLHLADVGISVNTDMSVAKKCADAFLTEEDLSIIVHSVITGRKTQGNMI